MIKLVTPGVGRTRATNGCQALIKRKIKIQSRGGMGNENMRKWIGESLYQN